MDPPQRPVNVPGQGASALGRRRRSDSDLVQRPPWSVQAIRNMNTSIGNMWMDIAESARELRQAVRNEDPNEPAMRRQIIEMDARRASLTEFRDQLLRQSNTVFRHEPERMEELARRVIAEEDPFERFGGRTQLLSSSVPMEDEVKELMGQRETHPS